MIVTPVASTNNVVTSDAPQQTMVQKVRSMTLNTNATPGRVQAAKEAAPAAEELSNSTVSSDAAAAATEETKPLSPQLAALARERRALQVMKRDLEAKAKLLEEQSSTDDKFVLDKAELKTKGLRKMLESGLTFEDLTQQVMDYQNGVNPQIHELEAKIAALEAGIDKKLLDRDSQSEQQTLVQIERDMQEIVNADDRFELVKAEKATKQATEYLHAHYKKTGELLDHEVALQKVEDWLLKDALRYGQIKKVQSHFAPPAPEMPPQSQRPMRTLTNRDTANVPLDRKARAIAAFTGTLKK